MNPALWLPCTQMQTLGEPLRVKSAHAATLLTHDNQSLIDGISSWWVNLHGHCHPSINSAVVRQLQTLEHTLLAGVTHPPIEKLAEALCQISGFDKAFFADSGSAAVEVALKMSLQFWHAKGETQRTKFISLEHGYHGETLGALSVTDIKLFQKQFAPLMVTQLVCPSPAALFKPAELSAEEHEQHVLAQLDALIQQHSGQICAFIVEPLVQGAAGMAMYSEATLAKLCTLARQANIHLIFDEIAVGFGRTGSMFAYQKLSPHTPVTPDFVCLSKGLTAGYLPMSAVLTTNPVYEAFLSDSLTDAFLHSHSFTGNPLAAAAALASLKLFETQQTLTQISRINRSLTLGFERLNCIKGTHSPRVTGAIGAIGMNSSGQLGSYVAHKARELGLFVRPIGNQVYLMPPYCITEDELTKSFNALEAAIHYALVQNPKDSVDPKLLA